MFPTPRSFSHPLCEHSMSSGKQKTTTLLVRILKRKGSRGVFKELAGCGPPLWHSHSWLCSWASFLRRVRSSSAFLHVALAFKPARRRRASPLGSSLLRASELQFTLRVEGFTLNNEGLRHFLSPLSSRLP